MIVFLSVKERQGERDEQKDRIKIDIWIVREKQR